MINLLGRSGQIFRKLFVFNASVLLAMTLQRVVLFLLVVRHWIFGADSATLGRAFWIGARFDLCVLGFLSIPALFIVWLISSEAMVTATQPAVQAFRRWILWGYLAVTTLIIHVVGILDLFFFANNGHRLTLTDLHVQGFGFLAKTSERWGWIFTAGVVLVFILLWVFRCLFALYRVQLHTLPVMEGARVSKLWFWILGAILPVVVVASAARGTWTAQHLRLEDAKFSQILSLNQLSLSPLWAIDKKF